MSLSSAQFEMKGLTELKISMEKAAGKSPKKLEGGLNKVKNKFKRNMKKRAQETYKTTEHITSGFQMSMVNVESNKLYSYFRPEANGRSGHAWHLMERGHELIRPTWRSRKRAIRWADAGKDFGFKPGKHLVDKEIPSFTEYMGHETEKLLDKLLQEADL